MQQTLFDIAKSSTSLSTPREEVISEQRSRCGGQAVGPYEVDKVYLEDCVEAMKQLPSQSIDIAIADPPYNLSKGGTWKWDNSVRLPGFGGNWSKVMAEWDNMPLGEYFSFTLAWLGQLKRVVRPTGSLWVHGTYHNIDRYNQLCPSVA